VRAGNDHARGQVGSPDLGGRRDPSASANCPTETRANLGCDALYRWLAVGFIGQWVLAFVSAFVLAFGLRRPQRRTPASIAAWVMVALAIGWYSFYFHGAYHAFKVHD
jgi:hypothetical protein